jgi:hypothetical protein
MRNAAATDQASKSLPDPGQILINARILALQTARKRALRPLVIAELAVKAVITMGLAAGIVWLWYGFQSLAGLWFASSMLFRPLFVTVAALATCFVTLLYARLISPALIEE